MRLPQRPVWSEGLLLSPQHLQASDRHQEALVAARVGALAPVDWGVMALSIDPAALAAGQVRLVRFAGIMPDGLPVAFEEGDPGAPSPRAIGERFPAAARALDVYLAVPREREGVPTFSAEAQASPSRFLVGNRLVADVAGGAAAVQVALARPNAMLLLGDEPREDHEAIRVARVVRDGAGQFALAPEHVPPCLRLGASPRLMEGVREVLARAIAKRRDLLAVRRHHEATSAEATGPDLVRMLQLMILNERIPALAHLSEMPEVSPREAYLELLRFAGQLGTFSTGADPSALPRFHHGDLQRSFDPLFAQLWALLGALAMAPYVEVPLEQRAGGLLVARLADERLAGARFFLAVRSDLPEGQVTEALPRLCKIACSAEIDGLVKAAAPGLTLQVAHRPPPELPLRPGALHFALSPDDRHWQGITAERTLAVYLPLPFEPARTKVELLAIPGAGAGGAGRGNPRAGK